MYDAVNALSRVHCGMVRKPKADGGVRFIQLPNADAVGQKAALLVADLLVKKPNAAIVFPTGSTPLPMYQALRHMTHVHWENSRLFHLDEYIPPSGTRQARYQTYAEYMNTELWDYIRADKNYIVHYTDKPADYEKKMTAHGGPDLVILGIGTNGHVAFNEPGSDEHSPTRIIELSEQTLISNFGGAGKKGYPVQAITVGLKAILKAKKILLLATGEKKREVVRHAFDPATLPSADLPASWLKKHPDVTVMTDFLV